MAYASASGGNFGSAASVIDTDAGQTDAGHAQSVSVPDAELLFTGDFERAGRDLILSGHDGRRHIVADYFSAEKHPALVAPNGARLSAEVVDLLAGSPGRGHYAQAQPTASADAIGRVEKAVGHVVVIRNGVAVALNVGDAVHKSDVIQTGTNASVGISFPDGTALNLVANTRMALNEYAYDPNGSSNVALISLVEGTFAFVAGKVAHTGDMKIDTPVATMGIRGTTGYVQEIATITANIGNVTYSFAVVDDYNSNSHGQYDLIDQNGNVIATVAETGLLTYVTPQGPNQPPLVTTQPMTSAQLGFEQQIIQQVFQTLNLSTNPNPTPQSIPGAPGSGTPPLLLNFPQQLLQQNGGAPFNINVTTASGTTVTGTVTIAGGGTASGQITTPIVVDWVSPTGGAWESGANWSTFALPLAQDSVDIGVPLKVTLSTAQTIAGLTMGVGAVLNIASGGYLAVSNGIDNAGVIQINSTGLDPTLALNGTVYLQGGGAIELLGLPAADVITGVAGTGATLVNVNNKIIGSGWIGQGDGALTFVNGVDGVVEAAAGTLIIDTGNPVDNSGAMIAAAGATLQLYDKLDNSGIIAVDGGGTLLLTGGAAIDGAAGSAIANRGLIEVFGAASLADDRVSNAAGTLQIGAGSTLTLSDSVIAGGQIVDGGLLDIAGSSAIGGGAVLTGGYVGVDSGQALLLHDVKLDATELSNSGTLVATGTLALDRVTIRGGVIDGNTSAFGAAIVISGSSKIDDAKLDHGRVTVDANQTLTLDNDKVTGTTFRDTASGATLAVHAGDTLTLKSVSIDGGSIRNGSRFTGATIVIAESSEIKHANLDHGDVKVDFQQTLTLDDDTVKGTTITDTAFGATLSVDGGHTLTLDHATIDGGVVEDGTSASGAAIVISGSSKIDDAKLDHGRVTVDANQTLTLDNDKVTGTTFRDTASGATLAVGAGDTLTLKNVGIDGGTISDGTGLAGATIIIRGSSSITGANLDHGDVTVDFRQTLTLDNDTVSGTTFTDTAPGATLSVDDGDTLTLDHVTIDGGTIDVGAGPSGANIVIAGDSKITSARLDNGTVAIDAGQTLTLDNDTVTGATFVGAASGATISVDHGDTLTLNGTNTIEGGTGIAVSNSGTIAIGTLASSATLDIGGTVELAGGGTVTLEHHADIITGASSGGVLDNVNDTITGAGNIGDGDSSFTLINEAGGAICADIAGAALVLNTGSNTIVNDGLLEVGSGARMEINSDVANCGTIVIQSSGALYIDAAAISGGTVLNSGTIEFGAEGASDGLSSATLSGGNVIIDQGASLTLDDVTVNGTSIANFGTVEVDDGDTLTFGGTDTLKGGAIDNSGTLTVAGTLAVDDARLSGGTIAVGGLIVVTGPTLINGNASLEGGNVTVEDGTLRLDDVTVSGTVINEAPGGSQVLVDNNEALTLEGGASINGGAIVDLGSIVIAGAATIFDETLTCRSGATLTIDAGETLTCSGIDGLAGGTIDNSGTLAVTGTLDISEAKLSGGTIADSGFIDITGSTLITGDASLDGGSVVVEDAALRLGNVTVCGTTITEDSIDSRIDIESGQGLTLQDSASIDGGSIVNRGDIVVAGAAALCDDALINSSGATLTINGGDTLTLSGTEIAGGTIDGGNIDVTGSSSINGHATLWGSNVAIGDATLTLDDVTVTDTAIIGGSGSLIQIGSGDELTLDGGSSISESAITNLGRIAVAGTATLTDDQLTNTGAVLEADALTLSGTTVVGGIIHDNDSILISGSSAIEGDAYLIGGGVSVDAGFTLTLDNDTVIGTTFTDASSGILSVDATAALTLSGVTINGGTIDDGTGTTCSTAGTIDITGATTINGSAIDNGGITIAGATLTLDNDTVTGTTFSFDNGDGGTQYGELALSNESGFAATIFDFNGTGPSPSCSDAIELVGFHETDYTEHCCDGNLVLTLFGSGGEVTLTFDDFSGSLNFSSDPSGDFFITDPPPGSASAEGAIALAGGAATDSYSESVTPEGSGYIGSLWLGPAAANHSGASVAWQFDLGNDQINLAPGQTVTQSYQVSVIDAQNSAANVNETISISIGGPGNDTFMFAPGIGADTIINFNPQDDVIDLNGFNIQSLQQLESLITSDAQGDAVIELGHNDSITIPGMSAAYLQAHLQSLVHLT